MARDQARRPAMWTSSSNWKYPIPTPCTHQEELEAVLHLPVDIVRYRERMNPFLKARIDREGKYVG